YLPVGAFGIWSFTDFADPRWVLGTAYIQLRHLANPQGRFKEQMGGIYNSAGWGAYFRQGYLFVKRAAVIRGAPYPDFGCNFEVFTNPDFIELETLGPLVELRPGDVVEHVERWWLFADVPSGENDAWIDSAVVGTGFVGRAHIEALRRLGISIQGVLENSVTRTQEACRALGITRAYTSLEELTGDRSVEVVHICTPNHLHFPQTQSALQAGKHVICEKPLAMNTAETAVLVSLAQKHAQVGAVNYNLRYYPLCQEAHALVQQGAIGEPRLVCGSYLQDW